MGQPFTMPYLESLSTSQLAGLAAEKGIDVPAGLDRVFIIGELLEFEPAGRTESRPWDDEPSGADFGDFLEPVALPARYGISYVDVLVRDPLWVFVLWETKGESRDGEYGLRVVPLRDGDLHADLQSSFTVSVGAEDRSLYVGINRDDGRLFRIDLCSVKDGSCTLLAESAPFRLPPVPWGEPGDGNRLAVLSGAGSFPIELGADRVPRRKDG